MDAEVTQDDAAQHPPSTRDVLLSGLFVSLITAGVLVRVRFGSLDGALTELAGALAGALFIPVAVAQLAARRRWPAPRRVSPLLLHAVLAPWAAALAGAIALLIGSSWALASVRGAGLEPAGCAGFEELLAARWSTGETKSALVARLSDGSSIQFNVEAGRLTCKSLAPLSRR